MTEFFSKIQGFEPRRIGKINEIGLLTLIYKEVARFVSVYTQTIVAPVVTALLFYTVFALAFGDLQRVGHGAGVPYLEFLAPGLVMMTMVQNAFANTSSSIVIAKVQGNIVDVLMPPLSPAELWVGYVTGSVLRGLLIGIVAVLVLGLFVPLKIYSFGAVAAFSVLGTMMLGSLGLAAGIWSEKFDHIAAVTNFIVMPLTFLSGTFYSIERLAGSWQVVAQFNPFFYMIDGVRYGFTGYADGDLRIGLGLMIAVNLGLFFLSLWMLRRGYKIKG